MQQKGGRGSWELQISDPKVDPNKISRVLGLEPNKTVRAGEPIITPSGDETGSIHSWSKWIYRIPFEPGEAAELALADLVDYFSNKYEMLSELLTDDAYIELYARASNCDYIMTMISPAIIQQLAKCNMRYGYEFFQGQNE